MSEQPWNLEEVIATGLLGTRKSREADLEGERRITSELMGELARQPEEFFPKLVQAVLDFTNAESAGISLLNKERKAFVWPAVVGGLSPHLGSGTPMDFGPCGTVLERNSAVLFQHPERHFTYLEPITPPLEEVLLVPFQMDGKPVGTIWAVVHERGHQFDAEDRRLLENLSGFAASAYRVLASSGRLKPFLDVLPKPVPERRLTNEDGSWRYVDQ